MREMHIASMALSMLVLSSCAADGTETEDPSYNPNQVVEVTSDDGERAEATTADGTQWICRRIQQTGSRVGTRVCKTRAEWNEIERQAQQVVDDTQRNSGGCDASPVGACGTAAGPN